MSSHTFAFNNASFSTWEAAKAAAIALAAERNATVHVVRDDGRSWPISPRKQIPMRPVAQQAPAQNDAMAQLIALVKAQNAAIDELSARLEALETKRRARKS